ncbi:hypothetical protein [Dongia deserti]|uniref:hypothetical protein n=1 Tax=Dongia deserti TaxID=2268030 RepID=UPI0013C3F28D|nr:hypothetical protein [Dongia deserti]
MNASATPTATEISRAKPEGRLGPVGAFFGALIGRRLDYYPRFPQTDGRWQKIPDAEMIERVAAGLANLKLDDTATIKETLERGRESLDEVKELTEYQDQKATRLLTIITFLSALSGILFARFFESYPLHASLAHADLTVAARALIVTSYALFAMFAFLAICGALVVFHATRTQFRYPDTTAGARERTNSYLFYKSIIEVAPEAWARSFVDANGEQVAPDLQLRYLRNYIVESYLVAAKVAEKLRYLQPAQMILSWSIRVLLLWLISLGATIALVPAESRISTAPGSTVSDTNVVTPETAPTGTPTGELPQPVMEPSKISPMPLKPQESPLQEE